MNTNHEFVAAMSELSRLLESGQGNTPAGQRAWERVIKAAPPEFLAEVRAKLREIGLLPPPDGVDEDGRPVYCLVAVANKLGLDPDEAYRLAEEAGSVVNGPIHRVH